MQALISLFGFTSLIMGCIGLLINILTHNLTGFLLALFGALVGLYLLMRD